MRISDWSSDVCSSDLQRLALAIVGRSPVARQLAFARESGWTHLDFYKTVGDDFARDYNVLVDGDEGTAVLMWRRKPAPKDGDGKPWQYWAEQGGPETAATGFEPYLEPDPTPP